MLIREWSLVTGRGEREGVVGASDVLPLKKVGGWGASFSHPPFKRGGGGG